MMYCKKCLHLVDDGENRCPHCRGKKLVTPSDEDAVFFTEKDAVWSGMVDDVLNSNGIPHIKKIAASGGISESIVGYGNEVFSFYVPYRCLDSAHDIIDPLFTPVEDEPDDGGADDE